MRLLVGCWRTCSRRSPPTLRSSRYDVPILRPGKRARGKRFSSPSLFGSWDWALLYQYHTDYVHCYDVISVGRSAFSKPLFVTTLMDYPVDYNKFLLGDYGQVL